MLEEAEAFVLWPLEPDVPEAASEMAARGLQLNPRDEGYVFKFSGPDFRFHQQCSSMIGDTALTIGAGLLAKSGTPVALQ
jgi:hypothetical protein